MDYDDFVWVDGRLITVAHNMVKSEIRKGINSIDHMRIENAEQYGNYRTAFLRCMSETLASDATWCRMRNLMNEIA